MKPKNEAQKKAEEAIKKAGGRKIGPKRYSAVKAVKKLKKEKGK